MKKLVTLGIASMLLLAGCGAATLEGENTGSDKVEQKATKDLVIGVSLSTLNNPFFVSVEDGIQKLADKEGTKVKIVDAQDDTAKQSNDVDDLIQQGVDVLLINPVDSSAITPAVESANAANIPVIAIDRDSEGGKLLSLVASNNVAGGEMAAKYIEELVGSSAKVAELQGIPGASATRERGKGFDDYAKDKLDIVVQQSASFDRAKGLTVMENMLQSTPDIQAVFAQNDEMALGAVEAIGAANKTDKIVIVGFDGTEDGLKAIKAGKMNATVAQKPEKMGEIALQTAFDHFAGKKVEKKIDSPLELVKEQTI